MESIVADGHDRHKSKETTLALQETFDLGPKIPARSILSQMNFTDMK
ncbi:MAG: hypothetical protein KDJ72_04690 [Methyloceanibacter sp.]|nr:hypothetical protein [Methyloceanibacter sp.]MCB1442299.1 hypothetical protein [Methyloceanibacter sp.]MCC0059263.1 hypothetical protein [Hyphomicrobiaceae bacterium]